MTTEPEIRLTPTEDLICEVLAARHQLGEPFWTLDQRHRRTLKALSQRGLVSYESAVTQGHLRARLTPLGRELFLAADYVAPALDPHCRAFYIGPKTSEFRVDCDRPRHSPKTKHRHRYPEALGLRPVEWTEAEAGGRASSRYAGQLNNT